MKTIIVIILMALSIMSFGQPIEDKIIDKGEILKIIDTIVKPQYIVTDTGIWYGYRIEYKEFYDSIYIKNKANSYINRVNTVIRNDSIQHIEYLKWLDALIEERDKYIRAYQLINN